MARTCRKCGETLTCIREVGVSYPKNASVDRIIAGGSYSADNVQLVCPALNKFRVNTSVEDFIDWCRKVTEYNAKKT